MSLSIYFIWRYLYTMFISSYFLPIHLHAPGHHKLVELSSFACSRKRGLCLFAGALQGNRRCAGSWCGKAGIIKCHPFWKGNVALLRGLTNHGLQMFTVLTGMILQVWSILGGIRLGNPHTEATHRVLHMQEDDVIQVGKKTKKTNT